MSTIIVNAIKKLGGTTPFVIPTADIAGGGAFFTDGSGNLSSVPVHTIVTTDPTTSTVPSFLGITMLNSSNGRLWQCVKIDTTPSFKSYWLSLDQQSIGFPQGQQLFAGNYGNYNTGASTTTTDYTFTVPTTITSICAVLVGAGGGGSPAWANSAGGGGALAWANAIPVTPGESLIVRMQPNMTPNSTNGSATTLLRGSTVLFSAQGGQYAATALANIAAPVAGTITPGNITSGRGGLCSDNGYGGGGGAGGYTGNGGNGSYPSINSSTNTFNQNNPNGTGGAGGGGSGYGSSTYGFAGGGGVGLWGQGNSGSGTNAGNGNSFYTDYRYSGTGGSGGERGMTNSDTSGGNTDGVSFGTSMAGANTTTGSGTPTGSRTRMSGQGGAFGGGGAGSGTSMSAYTGECWGGSGGARIIWGVGRAFPATNTGDVTTY